MISDGPYGPSILYSDGSTEHLPVEDAEPPPLVADITFESNRRGFEVWFSQRIMRDHEGLIEVFQNWLLKQPEVVAIDDDTVGAVIILGEFSESLKTDVIAWWAAWVEGLDGGG